MTARYAQFHNTVFREMDTFRHGMTIIIKKYYNVMMA